MAKIFNAEAMRRDQNSDRKDGREGVEDRQKGWRAPVSLFRFKREKTLSIAQEGIKLDTGKFLLRSHTVVNEAVPARSNGTFCADGNVLYLSCPILQPSAKRGHRALKMCLSEMEELNFTF